MLLQLPAASTYEMALTVISLASFQAGVTPPAALEAAVGQWCFKGR
jgi:hypothetical protein